MNTNNDLTNTKSIDEKKEIEYTHTIKDINILITDLLTSKDNAVKRSELLISSIAGGGLLLIFQILNSDNLTKLMGREKFLILIAGSLFSIALILSYFRSKIEINIKENRFYKANKLKRKLVRKISQQLPDVFSDIQPKDVSNLVIYRNALDNLIIVLVIFGFLNLITLVYFLMGNI